MTYFVTLGKVEDFSKGEMRTFAVGSNEIVVCNGGRRFYAFNNVCTHRAERLSDGFLEDDTVICAYHEAVYELDSGRPIEGPAVDPVTIFPVQVDGEMVRVGYPDEVDASTVREVKHEAGLVGD